MNNHPASASPATHAKALLLAHHAAELSRQCARTVESPLPATLAALPATQANKQTILAELATELQTLNQSAQHPDLQRALGKLRDALRAEMQSLTDASNQTQAELQAVRAAQKRLSHARRYEVAENAGDSRTAGPHFSVTG